VKFADLVRLLLASADADSHTLSAEIRLTDHYAALRTRARGRVTMSRAASDAEVPPGVVPAVLHALLSGVDDPDAYSISAGAAGDVLTISVVVSSEMPVPDRSAAGDTLQRWLLRQLDAACDARAELSFGEHEKEVEAVLRLPYAAPSLAADSPECDYSPDDHLCLVIDHAIARAGASAVRQT
jgi:hypothetical protein